MAKRETKQKSKKQTNFKSNGKSKGLKIKKTTFKKNYTDNKATKNVSKFSKSEGDYLDSLPDNTEGNKADFYVDDADLLDDEENLSKNDEASGSLDGSELDFDEEDYVESDSEHSDEIKKTKTIKKEDLEKLFQRAVNGNNFFISKIIHLFNKINSNKVETMDDDHVLNIPKYTNKLIRYFIKDLPQILIMKINNVDLKDLNKNLKPNEFVLENESCEENLEENENEENSPANSATKSTIKRYLSVLAKFIKNAEVNQRSFIFKNLSNCAELIVLFDNYTEMYLKFFIKAWAGDYGESASFTSLQTVKTIISKNPKMFEVALKLMYINYLDFAKANSWQTLKKITLLQDDIINILSFDLQKAYMTIFVFIRKLCIQLRLTINQKRSSSIKNIYNWQFINSLSLWTNVVCKYSNEADSEIKLLAYPLIQTIIGVIRLNLVDVFFPLRIILVNLLNKISYKTDIFIPCENYILEILESGNFTKSFKNKILNIEENHKEIFDLNINLKIKKQIFNNYGSVNFLFDEAIDSIIEFCGVNSYKISFPELGNLVNNYLRKISKNMMDKTMRDKIKSLIEKINENIQLMDEIRKTKEYSIAEIDKITILEKKLKNSHKLPLHLTLEKIHKKREDHIMSKIYKIEDKFIEV